MPAKVRSLDGKGKCRSERRMAVPLLALLSGSGGALAIAAIFSYCLWTNKFPFVKRCPKLYAPKADSDNEDEDRISQLCSCVLNQADSDNEDEDRISQLPDDLRSKILSHLPIIQAARMRILSRRWRNIREHRPCLNFIGCLNMFGRTAVSHETCSPHLKRRFLKAVHQSLQVYSRDKITRLYLQFCLWKEYASEFLLWVQYVARLEVKDIQFIFICCPFQIDEHCNCVDPFQEFKVIDLFAFPFQLLFQAPALEYLSLHCCTLQPGFKGQFNSLLFLDLWLVYLDNGEVLSILSSCLNLQKLRMTYCKLPPKLCISGQSLRLKSLVIKARKGLKEIELCARNLTTFDCYVRGMMRCFLHSVPQLETMCASLNGSNIVPHMIGEVAKHCPRLEKLLFQAETDKIQYIQVKRNMFSNLRQLYLLMKLDSKSDLLHVTPILCACPFLLELHLQVRSPCQNEQGGEWPASCYTHMKLVEFDGFHGTRNEIELFSHLLRSAPALELLAIKSSYRSYYGDDHWGFPIDCDWRTLMDLKIDDNKKKLIYELLMGQAVSSKAKIRFFKGPI